MLSNEYAVEIMHYNRMPELYEGMTQVQAEALVEERTALLVMNGYALRTTRTNGRLEVAFSKDRDYGYIAVL